MAGNLYHFHCSWTPNEIPSFLKRTYSRPQLTVTFSAALYFGSLLSHFERFRFYISSPALVMAPRKGLSFEEKRERLQQLFTETVSRPYSISPLLLPIICSQLSLLMRNYEHF